MKWKGLSVYLASLFLLYLSTQDIRVPLMFASMSLSLMYIWTVVLWMVLHPEEQYPELIHLIPGADLATRG